MQTALDLTPSDLDADQQELVEIIRTWGWNFTSFPAADGYPAFAYTTGFWLNLGFPEMVVFSLPEKVAQNAFWDIWNMIKAGNRPPVNEPVPVFGNNMNGYLLPVDKAEYPVLLDRNLWFYGGDDFKCLQLVWPDANGFFAWQKGFDQTMADAQPNLTSGPGPGIV